MAQTGYTPILIYSSSTASAAPTAGNLINSTLGSELAINITDGKLFYKDNGGSVQVIAWKVTPTTAGGTGLTSYAAGDTLYYATGSTLSKLSIGANKTIMTSSGTAPQWSASLDTSQGGTGVTSYTAGDLVYYASGTALTKLGIGANTTILTSSGSAPQWTAASSVSVGTATNLAGGLGGSLPYQSAAGTTTFLGIGAANTVLTSSGTAPQWSTALTLSGNVTAAALIPSGSSLPTNGLYLPSSNVVALSAGSTKVIEIASGNTLALEGATRTSGVGIAFPATQNASTNANTLDDYEEGTFTPTFTSWTGTNPTISSYGNQAGFYVKVGRMCYVNIRLSSTTISGGTGYLQISGLPFTAESTTSNYQGLNIFQQDYMPDTVQTGATQYAIRLFEAGTSGIVLGFQMGTTKYADVVAWTSIGAAGDLTIFINGCYQTNA